MTNIEKIMFDSKYRVSYMNSVFVISGFNHTKSIHINDDEMSNFLLDHGLPYYSESDWEELVEEYNN